MPQSHKAICKQLQTLSSTTQRSFQSCKCIYCFHIINPLLAEFPFSLFGQAAGSSSRLSPWWDKRVQGGRALFSSCYWLVIPTGRWAQDRAERMLGRNVQRVPPIFLTIPSEEPPVSQTLTRVKGGHVENERKEQDGD